MAELAYATAPWAVEQIHGGRRGRACGGSNPSAPILLA